MTRDRTPQDEEPDRDVVFEILADADCRTILERLDEPKTASDLTEQCDVPSSTLYRKLERMVDATIVAESLAIRADGRHTSRYHRNLRGLSVSFGGDRPLTVTLSRPESAPNERLA